MRKANTKQAANDARKRESDRPSGWMLLIAGVIMLGVAVNFALTQPESGPVAPILFVVIGLLNILYGIKNLRTQGDGA
ncbi:MAG: hypothetical protein VX874_12360 [Pseudomonadota bacterium]|nr:hypothetical protein [Pseudomonadota bacterium]